MNTFRRCVTSNALLSRLFSEKNNVINVRLLYNDQFLGIDKYVDARQRTLSRIGNMKENFFYRMKTQMNSPLPSMVFTEDLKTVIHVCDDKDEELDLCIQMMKKFHKQNKELRFGTFIFGPVAMRLFYHLKKKDLVDKMFKDPELEGFFDQLKSYLLCMDLYFKNDMYQDILDTFEKLKTKRLAESKFPREAVVLTTGACYKINTPETFQLASDLVTEAREARVPIIRRALTFVVALALNQNRPDVALEILSSIERFNNTTGNNLKLMALGGLDRHQDAFFILRHFTDQDAPPQSRVRGVICQSTLDVLQKSVDKANDKESSHIFEQICRSLKESNLITNQTVDEFVCLPIEPRAFIREDENIPFRQRSRFPDTPFRARERETFGGEGTFRAGEREGFGGESAFRGREREGFGGEGDFPRRRRYASIAEDY